MIRKMHEFTRRAALFAAAGVPTTASTAKGRFPKGFLWGAATAAHQVEGNNTNSDFWLLEHIPQSPFAEPSGDALDHYHRFRDDIRLLAALGLNTYRFSVEWARIEPEPGRFSRAAVDHYVRVALACREFGVRPMATFHHFTSPRWLAFEGGWDTVRTADRFARYCEFAGKHLGPHIDYACTLNEPNLSRMLAMVWPEYMKVVATGLAAVERHLRRGDFRAYMYGDPDRIHETMLAAHPKAVVALKSSPGSFAVGIALAMQDEQAAPGGDSTRAGVRAKLYDDFLDLTSKDDFVGVQT
jgi:beta-glucosidase